MDTKTQTRVIAEQIKNITGESLLTINHNANLVINLGLAADRLEALKFLLQCEKLDTDEQQAI